MTELGRLERIDPRLVWANEARDFTPWLLAHADHLAEALKIDIELEAAEHPVGSYSLDLLGRDLSNDAVLMVENQLGETDHSHLGQVLTYAAGTAASTIVWIATRFREEHRQALDWLNQTTGEEAHFFGLELEVVKIGDSQPAPLFNVVAEPNEWQKRVRATIRATPTTGKIPFYVEFWTRYLERVRQQHPDWTRSKSPLPQNWLGMPCPIKGGSYFAASFANGARLRHEIYIDQGDATENYRIFDRILLQREAFEAAYGKQLEFERLEGKRACRISHYQPGAVTDRDDWEEFIDWFFDAGVRLRRAFAAIVPPE